VGYELFQQFVALGEKPLKRLDLRSPAYHRAEATVLMRGLAEVLHIGAKVLEQLDELIAKRNDEILCETTILASPAER
jgi:hypothetical protein